MAVNLLFIFLLRLNVCNDLAWRRWTEKTHTHGRLQIEGPQEWTGKGPVHSPVGRHEVATNKPKPKPNKQNTKSNNTNHTSQTTTWQVPVHGLINARGDNIVSSRHFFVVGARYLSAGRTWDSRVDQQGFEPPPAVCQRWQDQRHTNWAIGSPTLYHLVMVWQQKQREKQPHHQAIPEGEWSNKSTMRKGRKWGCQVCLDKGDWTTALPCQLVRAFYAFEVSYSTFSWVERVASKSKPLDGPSVMALLDVQRCLEFQLLGHVEPTCDCQKRKG